MAARQRSGGDTGTVRTTLDLPAELNDRVTEMATSLGLSKSGLIRALLRHSLSNQAGTLRSPGFRDSLLRELSGQGSDDGPNLLSQLFLDSPASRGESEPSGSGSGFVPQLDDDARLR